jgi:hypothetical protein
MSIYAPYHWLIPHLRVITPVLQMNVGIKLKEQEEEELILQKPETSGFLNWRE